MAQALRGACLAEDTSLAPNTCVVWFITTCSFATGYLILPSGSLRHIVSHLPTYTQLKVK